MRFPSKFFTNPNPSLIARLFLSLLLHCKRSRAAGTAMACLIGVASLAVLPADADARTQTIDGIWYKIETTDKAEGERQVITITKKQTGIRTLRYWTGPRPDPCNKPDCIKAQSSDYPNIAPNTRDISFRSAANSQSTITLTSTEDNLVEEDEQYVLSLAQYDNNGNQRYLANVTLTILDDDKATISVSDAKIYEGEKLTFTATLDKALPGPITVTPTYTDVTATKGTDYTANTSSITFAGTAGEKKTFTVSTTEDADREGNEQFTVGLSISGVVNGVSTSASRRAANSTSATAGTGTITNDDGLPTVTLSGPSYTIGKHPFDVNITFSESVTGFVQGDVTVGNGRVTNFSGSGASYTVTLWASATGTVTVDVPANVATDADGDGNLAATQYSGQADFDPPAVTIIGPSAVQTGAFIVAISFSEPVGVFAGPANQFEKGDVTVGNGTVTGFSDSGTGASYAVTITPSADGTVTVNVAANVATDAAGNKNTAATQYSVQADPPPTVSITGPTDAQNSAFDVTITFSESVTGFVQGDVTVGNGSVTAFSGSGASYTATITPTATGTVTVDVAANVARTANVPEDNEENDNQAAIQYSVLADIDAPTVSITGPSDDQTGAFAVTVTFSESVTGFEQSDVTVGNGSVTAFSGSGSSYTATITPSASGTVTVDVPADVATDAASNKNEAASQFSVKVSLPRSIRFEGPTTVRTTRDAFEVKAIFSEPPASGSLVREWWHSAVTYTWISGQSVVTYTVTPGYTEKRSGSWPYWMRIRLHWADPREGYSNTTATYQVDVDPDPPRFWSGSGITGPTGPQNGPFNVGLGVTEGHLVGFTAEDITVTNGSVTSFRANSEYGNNYTVQITPAASGNVSVQVGAAKFKDGAGHDNRASKTLSVLADLDAPTVSIAGPTDTHTGTFDATITFSEDVTGFEKSDVTVGNGTITALSGSGSSYTATITPTATGTVTVDVPANVAEDAATNGNTAASQFSVKVYLPRSIRFEGPTTVRTTKDPFQVKVIFSEVPESYSFEPLNCTMSYTGEGPAYDLTLTPGYTGKRGGSWPYECKVKVTWFGVKDGPATLRIDYKVAADPDSPGFWSRSGITGPTAPQNGPFDVRLSATEGNLVGFTAEDITVVNGSVTSFKADSEYGQNYTAQITPTASGNVSVQVGAATFKDAAGHDNRASRRFSVLADLDAPTVSITGPTAPQNGPFDATITFSEDVTGFQQSDLTIGNGTVTAFSGSGANYTATITPAATGTVTVDVAANVAEDAATNSNSAASQFSVEADLTRPTVSIAGPTDAQNGPFDVTITFSEAVTGFEQSDLTIGNGTATAFSGSGASYKATIKPAGNGTVTVDVPANVATDAAGNRNHAASLFSVTASIRATQTLDSDKPTVSITGPTDKQKGPFDVTITFSEDVTGFEQNEVTVEQWNRHSILRFRSKIHSHHHADSHRHRDSRYRRKRRH